MVGKIGVEGELGVVAAECLVVRGTEFATIDEMILSVTPEEWLEQYRKERSNSSGRDRDVVAEKAREAVSSVHKSLGDIRTARHYAAKGW